MGTFKINKIEPIYKFIGGKILQERVKLGLTQEELAKKFGLTRTSVAKLEAGHQRIMVHDLLELSKLFKININEFFKLN